MLYLALTLLAQSMASQPLSMMVFVSAMVSGLFVRQADRHLRGLMSAALTCAYLPVSAWLMMVTVEASQ